MTTNFRELSAKDYSFIKIKEKHHQFYSEFQDYAANLTILADKSKDNKSGKASSYARYLIRLVAIYTENFDDNIEILSSFSTYKKLEKVTKLDGYSEYNKNNNYFLSATLTCYLSYLTSLNQKIEEEVDNEINDDLNNSSWNASTDDIDNKTISTATKRKKKFKKNSSYSYPRNNSEVRKAKINNSWKCEYNSNHETFTNITDNHPYIEAHHLIPMASQDYFDNTIDFADNIICLCPTCHNKIHRAVLNERKAMIQNLFKSRKDKYTNYGIDIDEKTLLTLYGIL